MIRVYINCGVKMNDYRLCKSIFGRSEFRETLDNLKTFGVENRETIGKVSRK